MSYRDNGNGARLRIVEKIGSAIKSTEEKIGMRIEEYTPIDPALAAMIPQNDVQHSKEPYN